jgi:hypothetical protein
MLRALDDVWRHEGGDDSLIAHDSKATADNPSAAQLLRRFRLLLKNILEKSIQTNSNELLETVAFVADAIRSMVASMLLLDSSAVNMSNIVAELYIESLLALSSKLAPYCIWKGHQHVGLEECKNECQSTCRNDCARESGVVICLGNKLL